MVLSFLLLLIQLIVHSIADNYPLITNDDQVRLSIQKACEQDCNKSGHGHQSLDPCGTRRDCKLLLSSYLFNKDYSPLTEHLDESQALCTDCDQHCPLTLAIACAGHIEKCYESCEENVRCHACRNCISKVDACCPCLAYGVGLKFGKNKGKQVCEHCKVKTEVCHTETKDYSGKARSEAREFMQDSEYNEWGSED